MTEIALVPALLEHAPTYFLALEKLGSVRMEDWMIVARKNSTIFFFFDIDKIWIIYTRLDYWWRMEVKWKNLD